MCLLFYFKFCQNCKNNIYEGVSKKMELFSRGWAPCSTDSSCYVKVLGTHLYQCTSCRCCERLHSASVIFFWRLFPRVCPFNDGWFMSTPAHTRMSVQIFFTKNGMTPVPHPLYSSSLALSDFFFVSQDGKSPQSCQCGRGDTKTSRSTKKHANWLV